jgi:hypothetical protein
MPANLTECAIDAGAPEPRAKARQAVVESIDRGSLLFHGSPGIIPLLPS